MATGGVGAEPRYIGTASCAGSFWVDSAGVSNHATLFENSTIETEGAPARVQITGDVRLLLDAHSRGQVDRGRLSLERGRAQLDSGKDYRIEARTMRVSLAKPQSRAIVSMDASGVVEVAALGAVVHVANAEGVVVANVAAGRAVELRLGQTSEAAMLNGCVVKAGNAYTLRDETTEVTVELRGADVASDVGRRVHVTGAIVSAQRAFAPADQVIQAKTMQVLRGVCAGSETIAMTGSRARTAPQADSSETAATSDAGGGGSAGGAGGGSTAGTGATAGTAGSAGTAAAGTATAGAASAGIGVSTAVIAGVAVAAAAAGTAAAVVATQNNKPAISPGR